MRTITTARATCLVSPDTCDAECRPPPPEGGERQWTAARCNRLLRLLSSKIALLRKVGGEEGQKGRQVLKRKYSPSCSGEINGPEEGIGSTVRGEYGWSPRPRKRIKRTYSSREAVRFRRKKRMEKVWKAGLGNEPSIRIPRIRRNERASVRENQEMTGYLHLRSDDAELPSPLSSDTTTSSRKGCPSLQAQSQSLHHFKLLEGVRNRLEILLKVTAESSTAPSSRPRSLFSTCLRKIPEYIATEELRCKTADPECGVDISSTLYNDLEVFGSSSAGGWKPLREVVRSHGINLLGSAMQEGLITPSEARYLVSTCLHHRALDEGERLVEYILTNTKGSVNIFAIELNLNTLDLFARNSGRYGFQYRQLTKLFREGILPLDWMSRHEMIPCWNRLIISLTLANGESGDAANLLRTALSMGYRFSRLPLSSSHPHEIRLRAREIAGRDGDGTAKRKGLQYAVSEHDNLEQAVFKTSTHLLTILTTVELLPSLASILEESGRGKADSGLLQDIALDVLQILETDDFDPSSSESSQMLPHHDRIFLPALAARMVLVAAAEGEVEPNRGIHHLDLFRLFKPSQDFADSAASFLCAVANCCGQAGSGNAFHYMQKIINVLTRREMFHGDELETQRLFERIGVNAAVQFSQATSLPRHLSWALDLESSFHCASIGVDRQTPVKPSVHSITKKKTGFRWEEGICEWVAGTPCIPTPKPGGGKQQYQIEPDLSPNGTPVSALNYFPTQPSPLITGVDPDSTQLGNSAPEEIFQCLSNSSSLHVLINNSYRKKNKNEPHCNQATPDLYDIYQQYNEVDAEQVSTHECSSQETPSCNPQTLCCKVSSSLGYLKHRSGRKTRHRPCRKVSVPSVAAKFTNLEAAGDSEDELSFS